MKLSGHHVRHAIDGGVWKAFRGNTQLGAVDLHINPNSVDVTLHRKLLIPRMISGDKTLNPYDGRNLEWSAYEMDHVRGFTIQPGVFILGAVRERFECSAPLDIGGRDVTPDVRQPSLRYFAPMIDGRSTVGRIGIAVHVTAGFGDYGFSGAFTLEIVNNFLFPVTLYPSMRIGQVSFDEVSEPDQSDVYHGAYSGVNHNDGPVPPQLGSHRFS